MKIAKGYDITTLSRATVDAYAKLTGRKDVAKLTDAEALAKFSADRQLVDLQAEYPEKLTAETVAGIAASVAGATLFRCIKHQGASGEAHLLVGGRALGRAMAQARGVASTFLADRRKVGDKVRVNVKPNRH